MNKSEALKSIELLKDSDKKSIEQRVAEICKTASMLSHNNRTELADEWADEAESLYAIAKNYVNDSLDIDGDMGNSLREAGARAYAQGELYKRCAEELRKSICEPKVY